MMGIVSLEWKMVVSDVVEIDEKKNMDSFVKVICLGDSVVGKFK